MSDTPEPSAHDPNDAEVEELLFQALERLELEGPAAVERLLAQHPAAAPRVRHHFERLCATGVTGAGDPAAGSAPRQLGEFRLLGPLGHGGMGVVYRAVQESLGREVAVKVLRPEQLFFPGARERFRREVELVARMQHPGIVPVYAVGSDGGVPYFAMELVHGASLAAVVAHLQGREPKALTGVDLDRAIAACLGDGEADDREPAGLFRGPWVQVVLRIVREIAEALEHAHRRGVLHRDVKPSNVLVTRDGRVLLLDFGLAGSEGGERLTRTGSALGSLAYMPPELLAGEPAARDARGDVYSLGATCWELLALRLPYQSSDPVQLQRLAGAAARPRLSSCNAAVTWDVETVVATALDPDPTRRYASASLFARDLDNLLQHRPIAAREAGAMLRLRRWTQRHPARATAAVAAALALVGGPSLWAFQESRTRAVVQLQRDELAATNVQLEQARARAASESARARRNFTQLQQAVDTMLTKVGDQSLRDVPYMEKVRATLLQEALHFYEGFLAEQPDDPALLAEACHVRLRAADVQGLLGDYDAAAAQVARVLQDVGDRTGDRELAIDVATAQFRLAIAQRLHGDLDAARANIDAAIARWQAIEGDDVAVVHGLADARIEASRTLVDRGEPAAAAQLLQRSIGALEAWNTAHPDAVAMAHVLAHTLDRAGVCTFQAGMQQREPAARWSMLQAALELHRRSAAMWPGVLQQTGDLTGARGHAAENSVDLGLSLIAVGRMDEARPHLERAVELFAQVVGEHPWAQHARSLLATTRINLAGILANGGDLDAAGRELAAAQQLYEALLAEAPTSDEYRAGLAHAMLTQSQMALFQQDDRRALTLAVDGGAMADRLLASRPKQPEFRLMRRTAFEMEADVQLRLGDAQLAAVAARAMLAERLAPTPMPLVAALLVRAATIAEAGGAAEAGQGDSAASLRSEATALLERALADGVSLEAIGAEPHFANELQHPEVAGFWRGFTAARR